jgi:hypothetical protein
MKKHLIGFTMVLVLIAGLTGCGSNTGAAESSNTKVSDTKVNTTSAQTSGQSENITLTINGKKFEATIEYNSDTEQIFTKLPLSISMSKLDGGNLLYGGKFTPAKGTFQKGFKKGDIALCKANYFIVFYADQPENQGSEYCKIGHITSGTENLDSIANGGKLEISKS